MNEITFQIEVEGAKRTASFRFASATELQRYNRSLKAFTHKSSKPIEDAIEFTRLAAKRWRYYSRSSETVESIEDLQQAITRNPKSEIAFIMLATLQQDSLRAPVGLAYCRRTWCHHIALDFLALHPRALEVATQMKGVGSGMLFGLVRLAQDLRVPRVWGEATANSAAFYEKLLALTPVKDLFIIEGESMEAITQRQKRMSKSPLS